MGKQYRIVTKEEAHKLIDASPGDVVMVMTYNSFCGISDNGKKVKKKKGKKLTDEASTIVLCENNPIITLNLHKKFFTDFSQADREKIVKSILLAKVNEDME